MWRPRVNLSRRLISAACVLALALVTAVSLGANAQEKKAERWVPKEGMPGKDVVWVPMPDFMVDKMLDIAGITAKDFVIDLGSGDGRNVIAAAKRGARARGVEYNEKLVALSKELAKEAGVADKAEFVQGDMYAADVSEATALVLFLLTENLNKLAPNFMEQLKPGVRIVINTFHIDDWDADYMETTPNCTAWCTVYLRIVPARVGGTWQLGKDRLTLSQKFQKFEGTITRDGKELKIADGRLKGDQITFTAGGTTYQGRVDGSRMAGEGWSATKVQ
jgi:SAM-dependent methyltransferase